MLLLLLLVSLLLLDVLSLLWPASPVSRSSPSAGFDAVAVAATFAALSGGCFPLTLLRPEGISEGNLFKGLCALKGPAKNLKILL